MLRSSLCRLALALSLVGASALPVLAQPFETSIRQNRTSPAAIAADAALLPASTAVLVTLPEVIVDVGQGDAYPLTVPSMQPLYNRYGQELVPANSAVSIRIQPEDGGAYIVAEHIIVNGRVVPLQARSSFLPGQTITRAAADQMAHRNRTVFGNLGVAVAGASGTNLSTVQRSGFLGSAFGTVVGLSSPDKLRLVRIQPGSVQTLTLQVTTSIPAAASALAPQTSATSVPTSPTPRFEFRNSLEYNDLLDALLRAHVAGEVAYGKARELIAAADEYAVSQLGLYPLAGIRARVTETFGYVYRIDSDRLARAIVSR
ncbi:hypothetical protein [Synechococcus sp. PCC 7336]|uniref:hypothetical protein n=1 Tax=Synechococcus sp. PCC 7336 TaxID=195250 RepID=UPI00034C1F61|nr:hypothetical protein [Synechococcus sp. PCC 7336]